MLLLKQDNTKKGQVNKSWPKLDESNSKKNKIEEICNSEVYAKESNSGHLLDLYYLVIWKDYSEEENT